MKRNRVKLIILMLHSYFLYASSDFNHPFTHSSHVEISSFKILGERCSGTNFVEQLILENFKSVLHTNLYGHKHWILWQDFSISTDDLNALEYEECDMNLE